MINDFKALMDIHQLSGRITNFENNFVKQAKWDQ